MRQLPNALTLLRFAAIPVFVVLYVQAGDGPAWWAGAVFAAAAATDQLDGWLARRWHVESEFGKVDLDMTRAAFESPVTDIELQLRFGGAKITAPRDAVVAIDDLRTEWKQPTYKDPTRSEAGGPRIRITGSMEFGRLKVRHGRA